MHTIFFIFNIYKSTFLLHLYYSILQVAQQPITYVLFYIALLVFINIFYFLTGFHLSPRFFFFTSYKNNFQETKLIFTLILSDGIEVSLLCIIYVFLIETLGTWANLHNGIRHQSHNLKIRSRKSKTKVKILRLKSGEKKSVLRQ